MNGYSYMAMTNYPYASSFLTPMPAWPVNVSCKYFENIPPKTEENSTRPEFGGLNNREQMILDAMLKSVNVYFYSDIVPAPGCTDFDDTDATGDLDGFGWNVLACNELAMPCSNGPNSMFITAPFDYNAFTQDCINKYKLTPRYEWAWDYFGGNDIQRDFYSLSNIIFSNG
jgi:lysosomal Pro-X carboxypeptidase